MCTKAAELNLIKAQRKNELRRLLAEEAELCCEAGGGPLVLPWRTPIPSEDELQQLSHHIAKLTGDKIVMTQASGAHLLKLSAGLPSRSHQLKTARFEMRWRR